MNGFVQLDIPALRRSVFRVTPTETTTLLALQAPPSACCHYRVRQLESTGIKHPAFCKQVKIRRSRTRYTAPVCKVSSRHRWSSGVSCLQRDQRYIVGAVYILRGSMKALRARLRFGILSFVRCRRAKIFPFPRSPRLPFISVDTDENTCGPEFSGSRPSITVFLSLTFR